MAWGWGAMSVIVAQPGVCTAQTPHPPQVERQADAQASVAANKGDQGKTKAEGSPADFEEWQISASPLRFHDLRRSFLQDQKQIWTSPMRLRFSDTEWLVPFAGITTGLLVTDRDVSLHLSHKPATLSHYNNLSNVGMGALLGGAAGMWLLSYPSRNQHWRETGLLAGQAALNSLVAVEALKYSLGRERPLQGDGAGHFFQGGTSFPSEHATAAWAVAGVIGHEYPGPVPKLLAYGLASLVSYSRIRAEQHFPADVFVGSIVGSLIAQQVYSHHHDPELGGETWRYIGDVLRGDGQSSPQNQGSPYVPQDSWVYPALDRLAGFGLIDSAFAGMRPWTRRECARLLSEAENHPSYEAHGNEAAEIVAALDREFRPEREGADDGGERAFRVESVYSRTGYVSGIPIRDGYHFAQTQINDFGRPYGEGWNNITGFSMSATAGRWVGYFRGEWQSSSGLPALPLKARETIQQLDHLPQTPPGKGQPAVSQYQVLDAYVGLMFSNWQISFGRQSLWWGPGNGGAIMLSDNAIPVNMFRINRTTPFKLPSILGWMGPLRLEFFLGQLSGQEFMAVNGAFGTFGQPLRHQPMIHGERFTFKPTQNFEFGFSRTVIFAGEEVPFTLRSFKNSMFSLSTSNGVQGGPADPGDRRSGLDWSYRVPKFRDWVTFYGDAFVDDEKTPIAYFDRSAIRGGLYFSRLPRLPRLDLRIEGVYTDLPAGGRLSHGFFYFNDRYLNGYTNQGQLLGSWIGRQGQGAQAWTNYWFSGRNRLQLNYRHQKVSWQFIPGGGTLTDVGVRNDYWLRPTLGLSTSLQYERWLFPVIQPKAARNVSATIEIQFQPQKLFRRGVDGETPGIGGGHE